jgi:hypothetical protein
MSKCKIRRYTPAAPNELQIDADRWPWQLMESLGTLTFKEWITVKEMRMTPSKDSGHYHIRILLSDRLPLMDRVALQAILGSDPKRELMNWMRVRNGAPHPILFLEDDVQEKQR